MRILEESSTISMEDHEPLDLPPGFRFHPTDEELITHYLSPKIADQRFSSIAIGEVDLNKVEPWDLPWRAKIGEKEWYFFCVKDRKYPTGSRTNRATVCGYWKATGKDKEIYDKSTNSIIVGMKKTLVFYKGRAPKGEKSNWVMHEYRLEGKLNDHQTLTNSTKSEWVISRIFKKCSGGKKVHISGLTNISGLTMDASILPPLMDSSFDELAKRTTTVDQASSSHVTCFSNVPNLPVAPSFHHDHLFPRASTPNLLFPVQNPPFAENLQYKDSIFQQEQSIWRLLLDSQNPKADFSQESTDISSSISHHGQLDYNQEFPINSNVPMDLDILWNF